MHLIINKCVTAVKVSNFSGHYLRNRSTLDIGVLGYIGIVQHKEHSPEVWSILPGTFCIYLLCNVYGSVVWPKHNSSLSASACCHVAHACRLAARSATEQLNLLFIAVRVWILGRPTDFSRFQSVQPGVLLLVQRPRPETDPSPASIAEVRSEWSCTSTPCMDELL